MRELMLEVRIYLAKKSRQLQTQYRTKLAA
jgi:hypothetical protein